MNKTQQRIIHAVYEATLGGLEAEYAKWFHEVTERRGKLDRKKKVPESRLCVILGSQEEVDLPRFIYAVEQYLMLRSLRAIELSAPAPLNQLKVLPPAVTQALTFRESLQPLLISSCTSDLEAEDNELRRVLHLEPSAPLIDHFQHDYMKLIPREIRHAIGSFFTPQWLARYALRENNYRHEQPDGLHVTVCDPQCGSGVFLIAAAEELRQSVYAGKLKPRSAIDLIENSLSGIDIELVPCLMAIASLTIATKVIVDDFGINRHSLPTAISHADELDGVEPAKQNDLLIGNPPWANWEYMPKEYREKHSNLWEILNIFDPKLNTMSFSKEDISALFVAHAIRFRLAVGGRFGFVLPESLVKSTLNHRGFRNLTSGGGPESIQVTQLDDFIDSKPFEGVSNRSILLTGKKGSQTEYPLTYIKWPRMDRAIQPITGPDPLCAHQAIGLAQLSNIQDPCSSWSTGAQAAMDNARKLDGANAYRARTGVFTGGANGVYHLSITDQEKPGYITVANVVERAKRKVPKVSAELEDAFIYPFLRGRDVTQWNPAVELALLLPHTADTKMHPVTPEKLLQLAPLTFDYFQKFHAVLDERKGFSSWEKQFRDTAFYAIQRIGEYTFADWKVVWRYISPRFTTAVLGPITFGQLPRKCIIPNEKLMLIACRDSDEAHFVGGVLASSIVAEHVHSRMVSTQISPSIVANISIPAFDKCNPLHAEISKACALGHELVRDGATVDRALVRKLDDLVAGLWGVTPSAAVGARDRNPFS